MAELKKISGKECVNILCNKFSSQVMRQQGSHVILKRETPSGKIGTVVPMPSELKLGTLKSILKLAQVKEEDFRKYQ